MKTLYCGDVKRGIFNRRLIYFVYFIIITVLQITICMELGNKETSYSYFDCIYKFFEGYHIIESKDDFFMPQCFFFIVAGIAYLIGDYANSDIKGFGKNMMINCKNRIKWWISKVLWNITTVLTVYVYIYFLFAIYTALSGKCKFIFMIDNVAINSRVLLAMILQPVLVTITLSLVQMFIAFYFNHIVAYILRLVDSVVTIYYTTPFLLLNGLMMKRQDVFETSGISYISVLYLSLIICTLIIVLGSFLISKRDLI